MVRDGAVVLDGGRAIAVGPARDVRRAHPGATVHDFGDAVILPGLVNAHAHLELSHLRPPSSVASFTDWLAAVMSSPAPSTADSVRAGAAESLRFGVTTVGDISREAIVARQALARSRLNGVSYGEVVGMAGRRHLLEPRLAAALDAGSETEGVRIGEGAEID